MNPLQSTARIQAGCAAGFAACLLLSLAAAAQTGSAPSPLAAGSPERRLSGIRTGVFFPGERVGSVLRRLGKPTEQEDAVVPDGAGGTRFYRWQWPGLRLSVATYFYFGRRGRVESRVAWVDVWGEAPRGAIGVTGRGLALGDTLDRQLFLYGAAYATPLPNEDAARTAEYRWRDGSFLTLDYGPDGRIRHIRLAGRER
ncbi:MAG: hypothetical protein WCE75_02625 [Terracidiphilus sp.]